MLSINFPLQRQPGEDKPPSSIITAHLLRLTVSRIAGCFYEEQLFAVLETDVRTPNTEMGFGDPLIQCLSFAQETSAKYKQKKG